MAQYSKRDPQNPYRTGVLIGNYVEDKFGVELRNKDVSYNSFESLIQTCRVLFFMYSNFHYISYLF